MKRSLPDLSRSELQVLRELCRTSEASVREIHQKLKDPPSYSTIRTLVDRLEAKGAVTRVRLEGKAWIYRAGITHAAMIRKEIKSFLDALFDGAPAQLVSHLVDMNALTLDDLREMEKRLTKERGAHSRPVKGKR